MPGTAVAGHQDQQQNEPPLSCLHSAFPVTITCLESASRTTLPGPAPTKRADFQGFAKRKGASELMIPADILVVDKVPVLGSGKLDYVGVTDLVRDQISARAAVAV